MALTGQLRTHMQLLSKKFELCAFFPFLEKNKVHLYSYAFHLSKQKSSARWFSPSARPLLL